MRGILASCFLIALAYLGLHGYFRLLPVLQVIFLSASNDCPVSYCGQSFTNIRFPFHLIRNQPDESCGSPGFILRCIRPSMMLIHLPTSGEFAIRSIDYPSQEIRIYDPMNCLPARLSTFDLSASPFSASYFHNYTLLTCPNDASLSPFTIACLSNSSFSTLATASTSLVTSMTSNQTGCRVTGILKVPVAEPPDDQDGFSLDLDEDITLTWSQPDCKNCEADGVSCGYANSTTQLTKCFFNGGLPKGSQVFRIIAFAMAIPAMAASLAIAYFMCSKDRRGRMSNRTMFNATTVTPDPAAVPPNVIGLDQATIESYTKVVLGESKRLPGHDDATCPICLSEYHVKETVRCIPECRHCFHTECIDEWLKLNGTCPICRNSPSPVHAES